MKRGFSKAYCLKGGYREWVTAQYPVEEKWTLKKDCVSCHTNVTPNIVSDWKLSKHSQNEVSCSVCHGEQHTSEQDIHEVVPLTAERCAMCHQIQGDQFKAGKHAVAWAAMKAMPTAHWQPLALMEGMKGCGGCHTQD